MKFMMQKYMTSNHAFIAYVFVATRIYGFSRQYQNWFGSRPPDQAGLGWGAEAGSGDHKIRRNRD
jgi:hypothetical protein